MAKCLISLVTYMEKKVGKVLSLEQAAEMAIEDYRNDKELTAFTALDGEGFYETR